MIQRTKSWCGFLQGYFLITLVQVYSMKDLRSLPDMLMYLLLLSFIPIYSVSITLDKESVPKWNWEASILALMVDLYFIIYCCRLVYYHKSKRQKHFFMSSVWTIDRCMHCKMYWTNVPDHKIRRTPDS